MGARLRNAIGYDIRELKSIGIGLKMEGGGGDMGGKGEGAGGRS